MKRDSRLWREKKVLWQSKKDSFSLILFHNTQK